MFSPGEQCQDGRGRAHIWVTIRFYVMREEERGRGGEERQTFEGKVIYLEPGGEILPELEAERLS